ncbi:hypothetical protein IT417_01140 [bacterium]|nr:hypothetical protein [bacterium]
MIRTGITNDSLLDLQPALQKYYPQGQTSFQEQIDEALRQIIRELKKNRKDIKKYCTPKLLQASVSKSGNFTSDAVSDDLERMLWQVEVTSFVSDCGFVLSGCNTESGTYITIGNLSFTASGTNYLVFNDTYKFYKVSITAGDDTTYESNLIESSFYHAHLFLSISLAYKTAIKAEGDRMDYLAKMYDQKFVDEMITMVTSYDEDSSGDISSDEITKATSIEFLR